MPDEFRVNPISNADLEMLSAYLDNQLAPAERAALEARLAAEPPLQRELDELRSVQQALRGLPDLRAPRALTLTPAQARPARKTAVFPAFVSGLSAVAAALLLLAGLSLLRPVTLSSTAANEQVAAAPTSVAVPASPTIGDVARSEALVDTDEPEVADTILPAPTDASGLADSANLAAGPAAVQVTSTPAELPDTGGGGLSNAAGTLAEEGNTAAVDAFAPPGQPLPSPAEVGIAAAAPSENDLAESAPSALDLAAVVPEATETREMLGLPAQPTGATAQEAQRTKDSTVTPIPTLAPPAATETPTLSPTATVAPTATPTSSPTPTPVSVAYQAAPDAGANAPLASATLIGLGIVLAGVSAWWFRRARRTR